MKPRKKNRSERAEIQEGPISGFLVAAASDTEQKKVPEVGLIRLSREAQEQFVSMLLNPPPPSYALLRALERHRELIVE